VRTIKAGQRYGEWRQELAQVPLFLVKGEERDQPVRTSASVDASILPAHPAAG
jgi:hypothetical protein